MGQNEENHDVYNNLTETIPGKKAPAKGKWTVYLLFCCLTACMGSFNFGYNIGALNLPTPLIKDFYAKKYYQAQYFDVLDQFQIKEKSYLAEAHKIEEAKQQVLEGSLNATVDVDLVESSKSLLKAVNEDLVVGLNLTRAQILNNTKTELDAHRKSLAIAKGKIDDTNTFLWAITNSLFVFGGMFGAFGSKYVLQFFGRKKGILFHYIFSTLASILALVAPYFNLPEFIMASRFLFGLQGGMMCGLIPTYLNEVAPAALRGSCGVINQLFITIGILFAQTLGFRQLLGTQDMWQYILAFPLIPSVLGGLVLLFFFSETPKALLLTNRDEESTRTVLQRLRNKTDVDDEIEEIVAESKESSGSEGISFKELFTIKQYRWPLLTAILLNLTQQLCGINAIFFYSDGIFRRASIKGEHIQYAIFATGFINVLCTIAVVPLIEKVGRKPLLVYPMCLMIVDFLCLTVCLIFQSSSIIFSYLSIMCIIVFICCFAVGLGPIPFIYATEVFGQEARGAALAACMTTNWIANLILSLTFEYLAKILTDYVFLIFLVIVLAAVIVIIKKVPETKNKNVEEIIAHFSGIKLSNNDGAGNKLMLNSSKI